jgi:hypothetical protein
MVSAVQGAADGRDDDAGDGIRVQGRRGRSEYPAADVPAVAKVFVRRDILDVPFLAGPARFFPSPRYSGERTGEGLAKPAHE